MLVISAVKFGPSKMVGGTIVCRRVVCRQQWCCLLLLALVLVVLVVVVPVTETVLVFMSVFVIKVPMR